MIIPLKIDRGQGVAGEEAQGRKDEQERKKGVCVPEWSMVELQGELISKEALSGQSLGSMTFENVSGAAAPWLLMRLQGWCESKQSNATGWNDITLDGTVKDGLVINTTTKLPYIFVQHGMLGRHFDFLNFYPLVTALDVMGEVHPYTSSSTHVAVHTRSTRGARETYCILLLHAACFLRTLHFAAYTYT